MRIIAGSLKGRRLAAPTWEGLRPTSDRLRETLFNILQHQVAGARVLDGFAGTGAIGIEALSRGAAHVTFVEKDPRACRLLAENLARCGVTGGYTIERAALMPALARQPHLFDLVILDPPYGLIDLEANVEAALRHLAPGGRLVLEHAARRTPPAPGGRPPVRTVRSGDSALSFYEALPPAAGGGDADGA